MTRLALAALGIAALVTVLPAQAQEGALVVTTSAPAAVPFGDAFETRVTVAADPEEVDVSSIRITAPLAPMAQIAPTRSLRSEQGSMDVVSFELTAACLDQRCVAATGPRVLALPRVQVSAKGADGRELTASASWPRITIRGRVSGAVHDSTGQFRTDLDPPPVTYRWSPGRTSALLLVLAGLLAAAAIALMVVRAVRIVRRRNEVPLTELERALALARQSEGRPPADRRRAVGLLARVLGRREEILAGEASTLAWSAPEPAPDAISTLVDDVGRTVGVR